MVTVKKKSSDVIMLAAGKSSRLGTPKGLWQFQDAPWLMHQLNALKEAGIVKVVLVLGFQAEEYFEAIQDLHHALNGEFEWSDGLKLEVVNNPAPEYGPFSSLMSGILHRSNPSEDVFVLPIDVPCANADIWELLENSGRKEERILVSVPVFNNQGGHPVWMRKSFVDRLKLLSMEDQDARLDVQIYHLPENEVARIPVYDRLTTYNLNSPEDWQHL